MILILLHLSVTCFKIENVPKDWMKGIIFHIYKDGDKRNPLNYRGITVLSVVSKVYTSILNSRLSKWCEDNNIIVEEQGGFRAGRGCVDQIFILNGILRHRKNVNTYCCFIYLKRAFDRVWRNRLWKDLWEEGVRGKMWIVIKDIYKNTKNCAHITNITK